MTGHKTLGDAAWRSREKCISRTISTSWVHKRAYRHSLSLKAFWPQSQTVTVALAVSVAANKINMAEEPFSVEEMALRADLFVTQTRPDKITLDCYARPFPSLRIPSPTTQMPCSHGRGEGACPSMKPRVLEEHHDEPK